MARYKQIFGFTLIELMVVIVVLAVAALVAVPSFQSVIKNNQLQEARDRLRSAIQYAKAEAISGNETVSLCPSPNGVTCGNNDHWNNFWLVVADNSDSGAVSISTTLRVFEAPADEQVRVSHSDTQVVFRFIAEGIAPALASDVFSFCDPQGDVDPRSMVVDGITGVIRYGTGAEADCS